MVPTQFTFEAHDLLGSTPLDLQNARLTRGAMTCNSLGYAWLGVQFSRLHPDWLIIYSAALG